MGTRALVPSRHALDVMAARCVSWGEVVVAVRNAEVSDTHEGRTRYYSGDLCIVVAPDGTVVTVLLRAPHRWDDAEMRQRGTPD